MMSLFKSKRGVRSTPEVHARGPVSTTINSASAPDLDISMTNSAPAILADDLNAIPIKSIMVARTLEESLHEPRRYTSPNSMSQSQHGRTALRRGTITFGQVNIREYERVLGDNPSITSGPPLSIGWRYSPSTLNMSIDDYEENKGLPRSLSEYIVPENIRVATLKEHAGIPHREIANAVRDIQKTKSQRRKTIMNLSMASTEELVEGAKIKVKSILRPSLSDSLSETKLWDEAHARATEKARELEESLQRGNGVSKRDLLSVGTPIIIIPCRRNSIDASNGRPISSSADAAMEVVEPKRRPPPQSTAKSGTTNQVKTTWINEEKRKNCTMSLSPDGDRKSSTVGNLSFNGSTDMQDKVKLESSATTTVGPVIIPCRSIDASNGRPISSSADAAMEVVEPKHRPPPQSTAKSGTTNQVKTTWFNVKKRENLNELVADVASEWDLHIDYSNNESSATTTVGPVIIPSPRNSIDASNGRPISSSADAAMEVVEPKRRPPPQSTAKSGTTNQVKTTWINDEKRENCTMSLSPDGDLKSFTVGDLSFNGSTDMQDKAKLESSATTTVGPVPVCYLCLDGGADENSQPLRRDCACRGTDAGFVHLSCLAGYAEIKSKRASDMNEFVNPWLFCTSCHQEYQNELRIDIGTLFVSFVQRQYPQDTHRQVEARYMKLFALMKIFDRLQPVQKGEAGVTSNVLLSLIDRMRVDAPPLHRRYLNFKAHAHNVHGYIAIKERTRESARRAVAHFENQLEVSKSIGDAEGIASAKADIAHAKSLYESGNNNEEVLKASQEIYKLRIAEYGEGNEYTIRAGNNYAIDLRKANRGDEARELLTKLLATSKQVLGSHHNITKEVESQCSKL